MLHSDEIFDSMVSTPIDGVMNMATVWTSIEVDRDEISLALEAADNLGYTAEDVSDVGFTHIRLSTTEPISVARLLANFWTEYADISELVPPAV